MSEEEKKRIKANKTAFLEYFGYFGEEKRRRLLKKIMDRRRN